VYVGSACWCYCLAVQLLLPMSYAVFVSGDAEMNTRLQEDTCCGRGREVIMCQRDVCYQLIQDVDGHCRALLHPADSWHGASLIRSWWQIWCAIQHRCCCCSIDVCTNSCRRLHGCNMSSVCVCVSFHYKVSLFRPWLNTMQLTCLTSHIP